MFKKIISFSLWGSNDGYCVGAVANAERAPKIYPGWTCRFYCDPLVPVKYRDQLLSLGAEIVDKPESVDFMGLYWRFEPMFDDPYVERFIVRDTDSRINVREADAVREWEESNIPFHIMRDNPAHNIYIMGGMWGARSRVVPDFQILMDRHIKSIRPDSANPRGVYHGTDQIFLCRDIWPYMLYCHMAHDEHYKPVGNERPFRRKLKRDGYVGMVYTREDADRVEPLEE